MCSAKRVKAKELTALYDIYRYTLMQYMILSMLETNSIVNMSLSAWKHQGFEVSS